ncbi:SigE family RNA polymerase sigma factor [Nocardioides sp. KR10-350]|uniref:SigE family RNA polymerase sigma factor n=1 Tax=Nocardioides cheoyonin TaxID=3156615 RepID=UPI0032B3AAA6
MTERPATAPSFDQWVEARAPALLRFAYLVTGTQAEAEDAVQSALERAYVRWDHVVRADDPEAYVRRMVANEHVSLWRRGRRREWPVADVRGSDPRGQGDGDPAEEVALTEAVRRVCDGLPRQQRAAVVLRYYEDRDYDEIADLLGCSEATARSHVHRALVALRKELSDD